MALLVEAPIPVRERHAGLLYGTLVADSLTLGAHWIYEQDEIARLCGRVTELQPAPPDSYHPGKELGAQTHYGDQALVLMESLETCGGNFVMDDFARRWRKFWDNSNAYRDRATKETLAHLAEGKGLTRAGSNSTELGGAARIAPLLAALRNEEKPTIIAAVRAQTALTHNTPEVIDTAEFLAHTVFMLMRGVSIPSALHNTATLPFRVLKPEPWLQKAEALGHLSVPEAVGELGQSCPLDKALPSVFAILLKHGDDPETALIENVMAGGDSAARGLVLGMLLGAAHGRRGLPDRWISPLLARPRLESFLQTTGLGN